MDHHDRAGSTTSFATETLLKQGSVPEEIKHVFRRTVGRMKSAEQVLWREVAARMTLDALGITPEVINVTDGMQRRKYVDYERVVNSARRWLTSNRDAQDADEVFFICDVDIAPVRRAIAALPKLVEPANLATRGE